jgi:alginate O-acetyltransferase complex protein AlgJ
VANGQVSQLLFGEQASDTASAKGGGYPQVIEGRAGWLFVGDDVSVRCKTKAVPGDIVARMKKLSALVTKSGRRFLIMIAPDKSNVYPQYLPESYLGRSCAPDYTQRFWSAFDKNPTPGYVDARTPLIAQAKKSTAPLYRPKDSHWNLQGISIEAQLLGDALDPALRSGTHVVDEGTYQPIGDLTYLLGRPQKDLLPAMTLVRDGVSLSPGSDLTLRRNKVTDRKIDCCGGWYSGCGGECDGVAECLELADVVGLAAFGSDAVVVELRPDVVVSAGGVGE